jgi:hypothetical protein
MEVLGDGAALGQLAVGLVRRFVDFVDWGADSNVSRAPLLSWWAAFVAGCERSLLRISERAVRLPSEMLEWCLRQVAPTLAVLERGFGWEVVADLVRDGRRRWKRSHRESLAAFGMSHL